MAATAPDRDFYAFGPFKVDPLKRVLTRTGTPIPLPPKVFDTLLYMIEQAGRLLDKEELLREIWPGRIVEEDSLFHNISLLRKALDDSAQSERYIITAPGRGYRFVATLQRTPADSHTGTGVVPTPSPAHDSAAAAGNEIIQPNRNRRLWLRAALAGMAVVLAAGVAYGVRAWLGAKDVTHVKQPSIAVLPFENLSDDKTNAWLAAGLQDEILTRLAGVGGLKVISRTSSERYGTSPGDLKSVGQQLGVADVLEGSVQRAGATVRVNVQLIDTRTDAHVWAHTYDRGMDNIFDVESNVAGKVADALQLTLLPAEATAIAQPSTQDASAYDLFLHAEYLRNKAYALMTPVGLDAALDLYTQALVRDPKFALAYAKRSDVESFLFWRGDSKLSRQQLAAAALRDAEQALALQPGLADAHVAMANYHRLVFRDFPGALLEYQKALITRPNDTNAMIWIASDSSRQGRWQQSIQWYNAAFAHDPNNHETAHYLAYTYWEARQYAAAERMFERAVALDPDDGFATWDFAQFILYTSGDIARAMSLVRSVDDPRLRLGYADLLTWQRNYRDAIGVMRGIPDVPSTFTFGSGPKTLVLGDMYWRAGEVTQARPLLLKGRAQIQADIAAQPANFVGLAYMWDNLAMADAELGDQDAALTAAHKALAIAPTSKDHVLGLNMMRYVAQVYAAMGRADLAVPMLKQLLATPGAGDDISPVSLRLDPAWDPIRRDPRFEALLKQQAKTNLLASS